MSRNIRYSFTLIYDFFPSYIRHEFPCSDATKYFSAHIFNIKLLKVRVYIHILFSISSIFISFIFSYILAIDDIGMRHCLNGTAKLQHLILYYQALLIVLHLVSSSQIYSLASPRLTLKEHDRRSSVILVLD